jgi:glycosyltransferase involved in cell wall biosynthesis
VKLAILFHRLGPYHHARLKAAAEQCELVAVEFSCVDKTYAWAVESRERPYPVQTLFPDQDLAAVPISALNRRISAVLSKLAPEAVAVPGWSPAPALAALNWCAATDTPAILMSDSTAYDEPRIWWREAVKRRVVWLGASALAGGRPHLDYLSVLGMPVQRVFTGYDVVDNAYFAAGSDAARQDAEAERARLGLPARFFLASNRFVEKKNLPGLLDAFDRYRRRAGADAWHLVLLGDGPLRSRVEALIRERGLADWVRLPGFKQYAELPVYYGLASAFVHASTSEQWGLVVNEAMASGLPVLVSNRCGCMPDLVAEGQNGYSFDPNDLEALAGALQRLASDDCDREAMGHCSRAIIARWTPETFARGLQDAAAAALAAPRKRLRLQDRALLWALMRR